MNARCSLMTRLIGLAIFSMGCSGYWQPPSACAQPETQSLDVLGSPTTQSVSSTSSETTTRHRLRLAALSGFTLLGILGVVFAYLQVDHVTRGFFRRRLQTLGVFLVFVILLVVYLVYQQLVAS